MDAPSSPGAALHAASAAPASGWARARRLTLRAELALGGRGAGRPRPHGDAFDRKARAAVDAARSCLDDPPRPAVLAYVKRVLKQVDKKKAAAADGDDDDDDAVDSFRAALDAFGELRGDARADAGWEAETVAPRLSDGQLLDAVADDRRGASASEHDCEVHFPVSGGDGGFCRVARLVEHVVPLNSKTRPKKLTFACGDGSRRSFLLKGAEDVHLDERVMQLLTTIREAVALAAKGGFAPHVSTYAVLPLSRSSGLIEWVPQTRPLIDLYRDATWSRGLTSAIAERQAKLTKNGEEPEKPEASSKRSRASKKKRGRRAAEHDDDDRPDDRTARELQYEALPKGFHAELTKRGVDASAPRQQWDAAAVRASYDALASDAPRDMVERELARWSEGGDDWCARRRTYAARLGGSCVANYALGLGDRHLENVLLDVRDGSVVDADWGVCFDAGTRLRVPEAVPFRLTPALRFPLGPAGCAAGPFAAAARKTARALGGPAGAAVLELLEVVANDARVEWRATLGHGKRLKGPEDGQGAPAAPHHDRFATLALSAARCFEQRRKLVADGLHRGDVLAAALDARSAALDALAAALGRFGRRARDDDLLNDGARLAREAFEARKRHRAATSSLFSNPFFPTPQSAWGASTDGAAAFASGAERLRAKADEPSDEDEEKALRALEDQVAAFRSSLGTRRSRRGRAGGAGRSPFVAAAGDADSGDAVLAKALSLEADRSRDGARHWRDLAIRALETSSGDDGDAWRACVAVVESEAPDDATLLRADAFFDPVVSGLRDVDGEAAARGALRSTRSWSSSSRATLNRSAGRAAARDAYDAAVDAFASRHCRSLVHATFEARAAATRDDATLDAVARRAAAAERLDGGGALRAAESLETSTRSLRRGRRSAAVDWLEDAKKAVTGALDLDADAAVADEGDDGRSEAAGKRARFYELERSDVKVVEAFSRDECAKVAVALDDLGAFADGAAATKTTQPYYKQRVDDATKKFALAVRDADAREADFAPDRAGQRSFRDGDVRPDFLRLLASDLRAEDRPAGYVRVLAARLLRLAARSRRTALDALRVDADDPAPPQKTKAEAADIALESARGKIAAFSRDGDAEIARLVDVATDPAVLCHMYEGWAPWV
ncbi:phosphatidylinositol kinase [Aureococcus anophagefferens]|nr:phosphatidylinositol kinase [Aureococcus anophagefferens]